MDIPSQLKFEFNSSTQHPLASGLHYDLPERPACRHFFPAGRNHPHSSQAPEAFLEQNFHFNEAVPTFRLGQNGLSVPAS
jgi:hypothetical protein